MTQIGGERYNFFTGCPKAKTCTIILHGGAEQFMEETEQSLHDTIMIVRRAIKNVSVVAGGSAIKTELSKYLRDYSRTIPHSGGLPGRDGPADPKRPLLSRGCTAEASLGPEPRRGLTLLLFGM